MMQNTNFNPLYQNFNPFAPMPEETPLWHKRGIQWIQSYEKTLDEKIPNFFFQKRLDDFGNYLQAEFAGLGLFNQWINRDGRGEWYKQLATFLIKLPMRAVRNIVSALYDAIRIALSSVTHPLKSALKLMKAIVNLAHEVTKPEVWAKWGTGGMAAAAPFSFLGVAIGGAMLISGFSLGALKTLFEAEEGKRYAAIKSYLATSLAHLSEAALTGFAAGQIMSGIQMMQGRI